MSGKNLLRNLNRSLTHSEEDHCLTAGEVSYQYDADGFLTEKTGPEGTTTYTYSSRGELLRVILPDSTLIEYVHDPLTRRIAKKVNGVITQKYLWQGQTRLLAVYDGSDQLLMRFEYADARMPVAMTKDGIRYYLTYDQVGSLRVVADAGGNVIKRIDYDSFGNILTDTNPLFEIPFGFAGGLHDRDTGLVRFGARDYDPDTGRWTAKDPILFDGGDTNLYGYCLNDPVNLIDPDGLTTMYFPLVFEFPALFPVLAPLVPIVIVLYPSDIAEEPAIPIPPTIGPDDTVDLAPCEMAKGERGWGKKRGDDPFWDKSIDELKNIEKTSSNPAERERAKKIRKMKEKERGKPNN